MSITDELLENHAAFRAGLQPRWLPRPPAKQGAVLACMDARRSVDGILGLREGDAHVIKDAGGVVSNDVIRVFLVGLSTARGPGGIVRIPHTRLRHARLRRGPGEGDCRVAADLTPPFALEAFAGLDRDVRQSVASMTASNWRRTKDGVCG